MQDIKPKHIFWLLLLFWIAWLYTEISEKWERDAFYIEVNEFMHKGDRFTQEEGDALKKRIEELEQEESSK